MNSSSLLDNTVMLYATHKSIEKFRACLFASFSHWSVLYCVGLDCLKFEHKNQKA